MALLTELSVFGGKIETTVGTKETLTATEAAYNVYDFTLEPDLMLNEVEAQGGAGTLRSIPGGLKGKAKFKVDLAYDAVSIPTWADLLFPACGLIKTSRVFAPKLQSPDAPSAVVKTLTIGKWTNGKYACIYGAMGTVKASGKTGEKVTFEFDFEGLYDAEVDATIVAPTYPTEARLVLLGGPMTLNSVAMCIESFSFDVGNTLYVKECQSNAKGYDHAIITQRKAKATANPESKLVATQNRMGIYLAGTEYALRIVVPAAGYNSGTGACSVEILAAKAQITKNAPGDRSGMMTDEMEFQLNQTASTLDSDFTITFNA